MLQAYLLFQQSVRLQSVELQLWFDLVSPRLQSNEFWNKYIALHFVNIGISFKTILIKPLIIVFGYSRLVSSAISTLNSLKQWKWEEFPVFSSASNYDCFFRNSMMIMC